MTTKKYNILIVDDIEENLRVVSNMLDKNQFSISVMG